MVGIIIGALAIAAIAAIGDVDSENKDVAYVNRLGKDIIYTHIKYNVASDFELLVWYGTDYALWCRDDSLSRYTDPTPARTMVLILYGNSEIGAHVRTNFRYLICLRHMIRSKAVANMFFSL